MTSNPNDSYWDRALNLLRKVRAAIATVPSREPSAIIGVLASAAVAVQQALVGANVATWREALPVLLSLAIRQVVTSPATRDRLVAIAEADLLERVKQHLAAQVQVPPKSA